MFERQIIDIVADRESGSSQLVDRIQRAFHCVENNHPDEVAVGLWAAPAH